MAYLSRLYIVAQGRDSKAPTAFGNMLSTFLLTPYHYYMGYTGIKIVQNPFKGYQQYAHPDAFLPELMEDIHFNAFEKSALLLFSPILAPLSFLLGALARYFEIRHDATARHLYSHWDDSSALNYLEREIDLNDVWCQYAPAPPKKRFSIQSTPPTSPTSVSSKDDRSSPTISLITPFSDRP